MDVNRIKCPCLTWPKAITVVGLLRIVQFPHIIESFPILLREFKRYAICALLCPRVGYQEHAFAWKKWGYELALIIDVLEELLERTLRSPWSIQPTIHGEWALAVYVSALN